jgi:hypothetical protein
MRGSGKITCMRNLTKLKPEGLIMRKLVIAASLLICSLTTLAQEQNTDPLQRTDTFSCFSCSTSNNSVLDQDYCDLKIQEDATSKCRSLGFSSANIESSTFVKTYRGGFCFDGTHGGRAVSSHFSTVYTCD